MREAGISKSELALRLGVDEKEVRRMLDAGHGTKLPRIAEAVEALGRHLHIALAKKRPDRLCKKYSGSGRIDGV